MNDIINTVMNQMVCFFAGQPKQIHHFLKVAAFCEAIAKAEAEAEALEAQMADPATYSDAAKAAELAKAYQQKKDEIERLYTAWEELEMAE